MPGRRCQPHLSGNRSYRFPEMRNSRSRSKTWSRIFFTPTKSYLALLQKQRSRPRASFSFLKRRRDWQKNLVWNRKRSRSGPISGHRGNPGSGQRCLRACKRDCLVLGPCPQIPVFSSPTDRNKHHFKEPYEPVYE